MELNHQMLHVYKTCSGTTQLGYGPLQKEMGTEGIEPPFTALRAIAVLSS